VSVETSSLVATRALLVESERITILSKRQIAIEEQFGMLQVLPCTLPEFNRAIGVTTRKEWMPSHLQREFYRMLRLYLSGSEPPLAMPTEVVERPCQSKLA
jgi:hypothetical protein